MQRALGRTTAVVREFDLASLHLEVPDYVRGVLVRRKAQEADVGRVCTAQARSWGGIRCPTRAMIFTMDLGRRAAWPH